jgi:hypothetical protein
MPRTRSAVAAFLDRARSVSSTSQSLLSARSIGYSGPDAPLSAIEDVLDD